MAVNIDAEHHIARYCSHQKLIHTDPIEVSPMAFELRPAANGRPAETYLSVNHCEHHAGSLLERLRAILFDLAAKNFTTKPTGALAVLNVGRVVQCGATRDRNLRVRRRQHNDDPSYASIDGMPADNSDTELLDLLAIEASLAVHRVGDIP